MSPLDQAMAEAVAQLEPQHVEQLKIGINMLLAGFVNRDVHVLVLLGVSDETRPNEIDLQEIMAVDCTDIHAQQLIAAGATRIGACVMADAPPRELFN